MVKATPTLLLWPPPSHPSPQGQQEAPRCHDQSVRPWEARQSSAVPSSRELLVGARGCVARGTHCHSQCACALPLAVCTHGAGARRVADARRQCDCPEHALSSGAATGGRAGRMGRGVLTSAWRCWMGVGSPSGGWQPEAGHCGFRVSVLPISPHRVPEENPHPAPWSA